jgi:hypothetical protein
MEAKMEIPGTNSRSLRRLKGLMSNALISVLTPRRRWVKTKLAIPTAMLLAVTQLGGPNGAPQKQRPVTWAALPLSFEVNRGQAEARFHFLAHGPGYTLSFGRGEVVVGLTGPSQGRHARDAGFRLTMQFVGSKSAPAVSGLAELPAKANYFIGNDRKNWITNIPTYAKVRYEELYPGIDLICYGNQQQFEYDFVVRPGADPQAIQMAFPGAERAEVDAGGDLVVHAAHGSIRQRRPRIYQEVAGLRREVPGGYVLAKDQRVMFEVSNYDSSRPLIIDPVLIYSSNSLGAAKAIAVDARGNAYITGTSLNDVFVAKLDRTGSAFVYFMYVGGSGYDEGNGIAVDSTGNAYVTGLTASSNFPTVNAIQANSGGGPSGFPNDAFVAKVDQTGSTLVYSTYLGGAGIDVGRAIAVDALGRAYVTGGTFSIDFPVANPLQAQLNGPTDAFVAKLDRAGSALVYTTYLGGTGNDEGRGIAVDAAGNAYVTGFTDSTDFPTVNALQTHGVLAAFVTKLDRAGSTLVYSTYLGGNDIEEPAAVAVDADGNALVTGGTRSSNFPTVNAVQNEFHGLVDVYVAKLDRSGSSLVYSTYLGGSSIDYGYGIAADAAGNAYVTGSTSSSDFPTLNSLQSYGGSTNVLVVKLNRAGAVVYSTYLSAGNQLGLGIAVDPAGNVYAAGNGFVVKIR